MRWLAILVVSSVLAAAELPPSPSTVPGVRIWPQPRFTHWPAIAFADESRNAAVALPVKGPDLTASWGWEDGAAIPLRLPDDADRTSGLVDLALRPGLRRLAVALPDGRRLLPLRVADAAGDWPLARLVDGFPVDADGVPVVLLDRRRQAAAERTWGLLKDSLPRPDGRPLVVGDPLESMQRSPWTGLAAELREATDLVKPHHACLVALASLPAPLPRTIVWCPGNGSLRHGAADPEEVRLMGALRTRLDALGVRPLLVLALPPLPVEERLRAVAEERRLALRDEADRTGWRSIDLARAAGDPETANRVGDAVFTAYPGGAALERVHGLLATAVAR